MTEDNTFKILRRIPLSDMLRKYNELNDVVWNRMTEKEAEEFFTDNGWTELEFRIERNKR
jgi:hypothetical protein